MSSISQRHLDEQRELARLWISVQPAALAYICSCVDKHSDAEDILQTVAQDVVVKYSQYDPSRPFVGWVLWLAKFRVIDYYRKAGRDRHRFGDEVLDRLAHRIEAMQPEASDRQEALSQCMEKLSPKSLKILEMRYSDNLAAQQVAERLGTTAGTIRVALTRIRKVLQRCVGQWLDQRGGYA